MIGKVQITSDGPKGPDVHDPTLGATELRAFLAMLERSREGFGIRYDYNPSGTAVQVEHEDESAKHGFRVTEWAFDAAGRLVGVSMSEGEVG